MAKKKPGFESPDEHMDTEIVRANVNREVITSPNFVSIYANDVQVQMSPWDLRLVLGEIHSMPEGSPATVIVRTLGELRISPQLAKRLTIIMVQQLDRYEKAFGEIPQPPD